ncbi:MAG: DNA-binding response regulator [Leptothrix sp. (in: Bacteria)]|nr:DNA-binding response regulator [Leptothrix sp. (in: b-proteobacteria)]
MLPKTLALVDDDDEYTEFLSQHLREQGIEVSVFQDSTDLLADPGAYDYNFYLCDLSLPGIDGVDLIKVLRRRTEAGVVVVSGRLAPDVFKQVMTAGADMYLAKPVQFDQVVLAISAVQRRAGAGQVATPTWKLDRRAHRLIAPDGVQIELSETDLALMECFVDAAGEVVPRELILRKLGKEAESSTDGLNATIYRLRRRIEKATPALVPLQSKSGVGYVFKAELKAH